MSTTFRFGTALAFLWVVSLVGCQNSPGGIFSPTSDIHVIGQAPTTIMANVTSGSNAQITVPPLRIFYNITNGVSVFLDTYVIRYYDRTGKAVNQGAYDFSGTLNQQISAAQIGGANAVQTSAALRGGTIFDVNTSGGSGPETSEPDALKAVGWTQLEVVSWQVLNALMSGTTSQADDLAPILAKIALHGRDINGNEINLMTQVTISNTYSQSTGSGQ